MLHGLPSQFLHQLSCLMVVTGTCCLDIHYLIIRVGDSFVHLLVSLMVVMIIIIIIVIIITVSRQRLRRNPYELQLIRKAPRDRAEFTQGQGRQTAVSMD